MFATVPEEFDSKFYNISLVDSDIIAAVRYNGLIYDASYNQKGIREKEDTNPGVAEVYCNLYNSVATKFLETKIKATYQN